MRRMALAVLALLPFLAITPRVAAAANATETTSGNVSYSTWEIDGATVRVRVTIPAAAARKLVAANAPPPSLATVASAVSQGMGVTTPAGDCEAIDQGEGVGQIYTLALTPGLDRFEIVLACPQASGLVLKDSVLFDRDPGHLDFAQVRVGSARTVLQAFTRDRLSIPLPATGGELRDVDPATFARLAAIRLVKNFGALGIIVGSVLLSRRWLDLAWLTASLTVGYLVSIAVALTGLVSLDQGLAEAMAGLMTASLGLGALAVAAGETTGERRLRWGAYVGLGVVLVGLIVTAAFKAPTAALATAGLAIFGLGAIRASREPGLGALSFASAAMLACINGLAPASDLILLHPPAAQLAPILAGHDLGGFAAAMTVAGAAMGLIWLAGRRLRSWRNIGSELGGAALIGLGLFWFVSRLYS